MFAIAYRNAAGSLRVGTPAQGIKVHTSAKVAKVTAAHFAKVLGRTTFVVDYSEYIAYGDWIATVSKCHFCGEPCDGDFHEGCYNTVASYGCDCGNCFMCNIGGCEACYHGVCESH